MTKVESEIEEEMKLSVGWRKGLIRMAEDLQPGTVGVARGDDGIEE